MNFKTYEPSILLALLVTIGSILLVVPLVLGQLLYWVWLDE